MNCHRVVIQLSCDLRIATLRSDRAILRGRRNEFRDGSRHTVRHGHGHARGDLRSEVMILINVRFPIRPERTEE
jgi:hypothetical protein